MQNSPIVSELETAAICGTGDQAGAVAALLSAAASILCRQFPPGVAGALIYNGIVETLALQTPAGTA
jgi:hypothetical protein